MGKGFAGIKKDVKKEIKMIEETVEWLAADLKQSY